MPHKPDITVVIPAYNDGEYLTEALESLYAQSFTNWECFVVNDCSKDEATLKVIQEIDHPKVTVLHHDVNKGLSAARNTGIKAGTAELIAPLDADDLWPKDTLQTYWEHFQKDKDAALFFGNYERFGDASGISRFPDITLDFLVKNYHPHATSPFTRTAWEAVGGYCEDEIIRMGMEDVDFHFSLLQKGLRFHRIDKTLYLYRTRSGSLSARMQKENYRIRKHIEKRHDGLIPYPLKHEYLQMGAIKAYRAANFEKKVNRAIRLACAILYHGVICPHLFKRAIWNIIDGLKERKKV